MEPDDYLYSETGIEAQGLDPLQIGKGIRYYVSDVVRDVLRKKQGLQRRRAESPMCNSALQTWGFAQMEAGQVFKTSKAS